MVHAYRRDSRERSSIWPRDRSRARIQPRASSTANAIVTHANPRATASADAKSRGAVHPMRSASAHPVHSPIAATQEHAGSPDGSPNGARPKSARASGTERLRVACLGPRLVGLSPACVSRSDPAPWHSFSLELVTLGSPSRRFLHATPFPRATDTIHHPLPESVFRRVIDVRPRDHGGRARERDAHKVALFPIHRSAPFWHTHGIHAIAPRTAPSHPVSRGERKSTRRHYRRVEPVADFTAEMQNTSFLDFASGLRACRPGA